MLLGSNSNRGDRREILRGVYEDNLRATGEGRRRSHRSQDDEPEKEEVAAGVQKGVRLTGVVPWILGIVLLLAAALSVGKYETPAAQGHVAADSSTVVLPMKLNAPEAPVRIPEPVPSIAELYGLHIGTIVIDAGHGGRDPGALGQHGLQEKEITLDIARRLKHRLEAHRGYRILLTRSGDETLDLKERIEIANESNADLFVSLHVNWLPVDSISPIETYYYGPESEAGAVRFARRENRNSGYSMAEFNELTHSLGLGMKVQESRQAAHSIQEGLVESLRRLGNDVSDWGAKSGDFMVLLGVEAPSVLAEIGSLSNGSEEARLGTVSYREKLAYILEEGILNYLGSHPQANASAENGSE